MIGRVITSLLGCKEQPQEVMAVIRGISPRRQGILESLKSDNFEKTADRRLRRFYNFRRFLRIYLRKHLKPSSAKPKIYPHYVGSYKVMMTEQLGRSARNSFANPIFASIDPWGPQANSPGRTARS